MTDITKAPERIFLDYDAEAGEGSFPRCFENSKYCSEPAIEYIRFDIVQRQAGETPTDAQLADACLSYNHSYGLMNTDQRDNIEYQCKEWWRCIARALAKKERK